ncbi:MAG: proton-conducting transporter membrane subunit [bacterium]
MPMPFIIYAVLIVLAGMICFSLQKNNAIRKYLTTVIISGGGILALVYLFRIFQGIDRETVSKLMEWQMPFGNMVVGIDALSAFFLIPLLILAISSAFYAPQYFGKHEVGKAHWFFLSLLIGGMVMVLLARNAVLFILSWEVMSLASFFLVITDKSNPKTLHAGWIYFVTAHIGTAFLLALFFLLSSTGGSFDFMAWKGVSLSAGKADILFILALTAFGLKAGFIPFHVWLPLAHPAAPSHVSALMSGIMIKMGIYGILRILMFIAPYHAWWGELLIVLGGISGVLGVLFAIGQHDIKRLLAYHSVENIGIILLGIGIGIVGSAYGMGVIALFGFAGGLLHVLNHSLFKALLFLGAGVVIKRTGSGEIDRLGGLMKTMPRTALLFLVGATAICGLPFFNGFISELMIYVASLHGVVNAPHAIVSWASLAVIISLALIGGLAAACFTKVFGIVFLGEPRTEDAQISGKTPSMMLWAMALLAVLCVLIGMFSIIVFPFLIQPASALAGAVAAGDQHELYSFTVTISVILCFLVLAAIFVIGLMKMLIRKKQPVEEGVTWDCGYSMPSVSMQYTASSFADPIIKYFELPLAAHQKLTNDHQFFPSNKWTFHSEVDDWFLSKIYTPGIHLFDRVFASLRWFQSGKTGQYVFYIALTVFCLIVWKFFL